MQTGQSSFLHTDIHPVALVNLTREQGSKTSICGNQLIIDTSDWKLMADAASGRLDEVLLRNEDGSNLQIKLHVRPGAARELAQQLRTSAEEYEGYAQGSELPPFLSFALDELAYQISSMSNQDVSRQATALANSMNEVLRAWWAKIEGPVAIAPGASDTRISRFKIEQLAAHPDDLSHLPHLGPALADAAFPRGGVPWTLVREICFVLEGKRDRGHFDELRRLISADEMGPLACLAVAELLEDNAAASAQVAQLGLNSLDEAHVRRDLESLLPRDSGMRAVINATGQVARAVPSDFHEGVLATLPSDVARILVNWSQALERDRDTEPAVILMEFLFSEWKSDLAEVVKARLQQLASRATAGPGR
jgi:hypothetical protein